MAVVDVRGDGAQVGADRVETVVGLCRRWGFVFPCAEIYDPTRAAWDYGPLGVELKDNIKRQWWKAVVTGRDDVVGLDSAVILPSPVWSAVSYPQGRMLRVSRGPADDEKTPYYLRPDIAQGAFVNFHNVIGAARKKPPFGIGQMGKSFRNEADPGNFLFRTHEFEQMALAFFVEPGTDDHWHRYWAEARTDWYVDLGLQRENLRLHERAKETIAHYSKLSVDVEYRFNFSDGPEWAELEAVTNRADFDLATHSNNSGVDLSYYDPATESRYRPYVIEAAAGVSRPMMAFLLEAYGEDLAPNIKGGLDRRVVLRLDRRLAPVKAAVLPQSRNPDLSPKARDLAAALRRNWNVDFDDAGAIGRRYRRQDEIGTPFCVTVDFDTLLDHSVTVRDRDSMSCERIGIDQVEPYLSARLTGC